MDEKEQQRKDIFDRLEKLPPELKDVMFSTVTADKMFDIGKRHGLLVDKLGEMAHETGLLMLGVTHPDEFVGNLATRLEVDKQKAKAIAEDINREILSPVREHLQVVFSGTSENAKQTQTPVPKQASPQAKSAVNHESEIMNYRKGELDSRSPIVVEDKLRGNDKVLSSTKPETTLEDLEAELEKVLAEEKGEQPLSVVKQQPSETVSKARDIYKGADPYREQVEEHMPNVRGAPYTPSKEKEEKSASPLEKEVTGDLGVKNGSLQAFRGFNMNNLPKQQPPSKEQVVSSKYQGKEEQQPPADKQSVESPPRYGFAKNPVTMPAIPSVPKPPQMSSASPTASQSTKPAEKDPYRESIK